MKRVSEQISGYKYGDAVVSSATLQDLENLKVSVGWTDQDDQYRHMAGEVLSGQTRQLVDHWRRGIIAGIPNLSRHSRTPDGEPLPDYQAKSGLRFEQWVLDTCFRAYDQDWLNYQHEIALRHTPARKNQTDAVRSTPQVPLPDVIVRFSAVTLLLSIVLLKLTAAPDGDPPAFVVSIAIFAPRL